MLARLLYVLSCLFLGLLRADAYTQTFWPPQIPLAVRSPYFSAWQAAKSGDSVLATWPTFWYQDPSSTPIVGWQGLIRVDGSTYRWLGDSDVNPTSANLSSFQITPTRSIFNIVAGAVDLSITFLTPIEPSDWVRQSMPFSYLSLNATSNDGQEHTVEVYCDISAEWLSGNRSAIAEWQTVTSDGVIYHESYLQNPAPFVEYLQQAEDGNSYIAMLYESSESNTISYMTGRDQTVRNQFTDSGGLPDTADTDFRAIDNDYPVFGIAYNLGSVTSATSPVVWAVGYIRSPSIEYTTPSGETQLRYPYWATEYSSVGEVIYAFLNDYDDALERSITLDEQLAGNASLISSNYSDLISISARQAFGGIDITVSNGTDGTLNISDTMIFMKDIGNANLVSRVNPVEVMYEAMPMFLYFNASYLGALLYPVLESASSTDYTNQYAPSDIGKNYPVAGGDTSSSDEGVEQSGNMLIMALAHAKISGDGTLISRYYNLLKTWATYLQSNTEFPQNQESADTQNTANMTNLALKGIIGLRAMSEISSVVGESSDSSAFSNLSETYYDVWQSLGVSSSDSNANVLFTFGDSGSWTLLYNLYADRLLGTDLVSDSIIANQSTYYSTLLASGSGGPYGLPIDSDDGTSGNSAWMLFAAASASDSSVRDELLDLVWARASDNSTGDVFPTMFDISTGAANAGAASPGQGAMFAPLALNLSTKTIVVPPSTTSTNSPSKSKTDVGAIVGGVVGGIAGLSLVILLGFFYWRRRWQYRVDTEAEKDTGTDGPVPVPFPYNAVPTGSPSAPQEVAEERDPHSPPSNPSASAYTSTSPPSSREPLSSVDGSRSRTGGSGSVPSSELLNLRSEVDDLRRFMQEIQMERLEAPPSYFPGEQEP